MTKPAFYDETGFLINFEMRAAARGGISRAREPEMAFRAIAVAATHTNWRNGFG
jgi:hypothetical protein